VDEEPAPALFIDVRQNDVHPERQRILAAEGEFFFFSFGMFPQ
jgi:hypothetical protein